MSAEFVKSYRLFASAASWLAGLFSAAMLCSILILWAHVEPSAPPPTNLGWTRPPDSAEDIGVGVGWGEGALQKCPQAV